MSMLAERKVKQKWSLNPRGSNWSNDSTKFGQKMLEKMGWSKGKGLGAKEDGITEHVKVSYKNDSKGMGYKESNDQWTEHESHFNSLLQSLSGSNENSDIDTNKIASLEKKSQSSRARVHYKKFTRGKDLSRCSEKDLANIFGKKSLKEPKKPQLDTIEESQTKQDSFLHNSGSMLDYFKKKLPNFGKSGGYVVGSNGVLKKDSDSNSEDEGYVGFGFRQKLSSDKIDGMEVEENEEGVKNPAFEPLGNNVEVQKHLLNTIVEEDEYEEAENEDNSQKNFDRSLINQWEETSFLGNSEGKKKKNKKPNSNLDEIINLDEEDTSNSINISNLKKRKKKDKSEDSDTTNNEESQDNNTFEIKRKKKNKNAAKENFDIIEIEDDSQDVKRKKKKKIEEGQDNSNFDPSIEDLSTSNNTFEVKRKKKKKKKDEEREMDTSDCIAIDNPTFNNTPIKDAHDNNVFEIKRKKNNNEESEATTLDNNTFEVKRKKKKRNEDNNNLAIDNPLFNNTPIKESHDNNTFEIKRKKRKHSEETKENDSFAIINPNFNNIESSEEIQDNNKFEVKRKKKKEKQTNSENDISSVIEAPPTPVTIATEDISTNIELDLVLNVTSTPQANSTLISNAKQSTIKRRKSVRFNDVTESRIIPNNDDQKRNELFDINSRVLSLEQKIDGYQAEIENDLNERKVLNFVGEVGNPDGENEKLENGVKLKFKHAQFQRSPGFMNRKFISLSKSSYKHLIKGDIVLGFNNTNLHEIKGYAVNDCKENA